MSFYRNCYCSLLSVRPHPVTSAADWERHIQAQEQDRLDELFPSPKPNSSASPEPDTRCEDPPSPEQRDYNTYMCSGESEREKWYPADSPMIENHDPVRECGGEDGGEESAEELHAPAGGDTDYDGDLPDQQQ